MPQPYFFRLRFCLWFYHLKTETELTSGLHDPSEMCRTTTSRHQMRCWQHKQSVTTFLGFRLFQMSTESICSICSGHSSGGDFMQETSAEADKRPQIRQRESEELPAPAGLDFSLNSVDYDGSRHVLLKNYLPGSRLYGSLKRLCSQ